MIFQNLRYDILLDVSEEVERFFFYYSAYRRYYWLVSRVWSRLRLFRFIFTIADCR